MSHAADVDGHMVGQRIGYTRVSTVAQTLDQQNDALAKAGVSKTFSDTMSGARDDRPGLAELMAYVREGDTVVVWKLDRLGRDTLHILETVKTLTDRGVTLVSVTDGIDSSTSAGRMMIGVLGSLAEYERELTKERTALKRASSRANGTKFGRPKKVFVVLIPMLVVITGAGAYMTGEGRKGHEQL
jgi:DNA invertase Pin-like site-specific DNA recombinase